MKRILFVDDEQELLNSLRARLHKRRAEWDMVFLSSADAAFVELEKKPADMVITDVRMPGMDGRELLSAVKARWPETIRIVLSGYSDEIKLLQLVSLAHQYLSKPCDAKVLENLIERCFHLQDFLQDEPLRSIVGRIGKLPTMPKVYAQLQAALSEPDVSNTKVADIIARDAVIAGKVLQVANSSFFRLSKPITRIKDAVGYLGFGSIRNLVMSAEIFSKWEHVEGPAGLQVEQLQTHALASAAACAALAVGTPLADDAWLAGLIHDIGYWVLIQECPAELNRAVQLAQDQGLLTHIAEQQVIGTTHAEVGAYLLGLWGLPYSLVEAVAFHHQPGAIMQHSFELPGLLAVAHSLLGTDESPTLQLSGEMIPGVDAEFFANLNAPFDWAEAQRRVRATYATAVS